MPRPRKNPDELLSRELRITPPNGEEILNWCLDDSVKKFVAFCEGGADTGKKLHYHCYIETTMTTQALPKWIYTVCGCTETGERGNAVFFTRSPHEHTFGYIAKGKDVAIRHNFPQTFIDEWFKASDSYVKSKERDRKRDQRNRQDELREVTEQVKSDLKANNCGRDVSSVVRAFLKYCKHGDIRFPIRSQLEPFVIELLYPYDDHLVIQYYTRSFPTLF